MLINLIKRKQWFMFKVLLTSLVVSCVVAPLLVAARQGNQLPSDRIVFSWNRDGDYDLYLMDANVQQVVMPLTDNSASDVTPVWSPDGTHVALASNVNGNNYEIYVLNPATGESDVLTNNTWDDLYPAWSPDGKQIAFTSNRDSNWDIYVMDANGKNPQRLTTDPGYQGSPVWSPDGTRIAYVEGRDAKRDIMVMNADGSNVQPLTALATSADYSPAWSPDGTQIAFVSTRSGNPDIFVVDATCISSNSCDQVAVNLTSDNQGDDLDPAWRPDGQQLVFASVRGSAKFSDLYLMDVTGANVTQITATDGDERFPSWWHQG
ncbi:MAG: PD40 domain-containing protein [Anaerolineae bacterium]|nr:PD40 domain-containing protein [Anaerolineae bacterium]